MGWAPPALFQPFGGHDIWEPPGTNAIIASLTITTGGGDRLPLKDVPPLPVGSRGGEPSPGRASTWHGAGLMGRKTATIPGDDGFEDAVVHVRRHVWRLRRRLPFLDPRTRRPHKHCIRNQRIVGLACGAVANIGAAFRRPPVPGRGVGDSRALTIRSGGSNTTVEAGARQQMPCCIPSSTPVFL
jgi:hypothetical protein